MRHSNFRILFTTLCGLALAYVMVACNDPPESTNAEADRVSKPSVTGTVSYRERMALSDRAELNVALLDVSRQDVAATVIAEQTVSNPGQVPIRFELTYDPAKIDERMSYSLRATIHDRGRMVFTSDTHTPVLTRGAGREAHMTLVAVPQSPQRQQEPPQAEAGMGLQGMFRYMADAALFRDCRTGKTFPVSMEGGYIELERAYLNSGIESGYELMVQLKGRYLERPAMEGNRNEVSLIVDKLEKIDPENSCAPTEHAALQNTYWKLIELDGKPVKTPANSREAHIILSTERSGAHGHAGCNNFFGNYSSASDTLTFSALGSTMKACPEGMDTEQAFLQALGETTRYEISGQFLTLFAKDRPLARLEAVYLP
jgi:uncharacterized lipoprotein YbaY/heat shock protein HslJ